MKLSMRTSKVSGLIKHEGMKLKIKVHRKRTYAEKTRTEHHSWFGYLFRGHETKRIIV